MQIADANFASQLKKQLVKLMLAIVQRMVASHIRVQDVQDHMCNQNIANQAKGITPKLCYCSDSCCQICGLCSQKMFLAESYPEHFLRCTATGTDVKSCLQLRVQDAFIEPPRSSINFPTNGICGSSCHHSKGYKLVLAHFFRLPEKYNYSA